MLGMGATVGGCVLGGLGVGVSVGILPQAEPSVRFANMAENHGLGVFATQPDL